MTSRTSIMNNFGLYQGRGDDSYPTYLHDGLDFMLPDGTAVFAVKGGTLRDLHFGTAACVTIEDEDLTDRGWQYAHVVPAEGLAQGQKLSQGQFIGVILAPQAHIHLTRVLHLPGKDWWSGTLSLYGNDFFELPDALAPESLGGLRYFRNASSQEIPREAIPVLSGAVDVVAGLRDAMGNPYYPGLAERLAPSRFELEVRDEEGTLRWTHRSDLRMLALTPPFLGDPGAARNELTLFFKTPTLLGEPSWATKGFTWWVITNLPDHATLAPITETDVELHWDTASVDDAHQPRFPNGRYTLTLTVFDASGQSVQVLDTVQVSN